MRGVPSSVMPGFMPGIHVFLVAKTWMASELGLARVRQIKKTVSRVNPTYGDEPGHDARDLNAAIRLEVDGCAAISNQEPARRRSGRSRSPAGSARGCGSC